MLNHQYHFLARGEKKPGRGRPKKEIESLQRLGQMINISVIVPKSGKKNHFNASVTRLGDLLIEKIKSQILSGELKEGDLMPSEKEYAEQFGIGRSTVRETIKTLAHMGVVRTMQGRGTFVTEKARDLITHTKALVNSEQQWSFYEAYETRLVLETELAALAALRASRDDCQQMERALARIERSFGLPGMYVEAYLQLMKIVAHAAGNRILALLHAETDEFGKKSMEKILKISEVPAQIANSWKNIVHNIKKHNPDQTRASASQCAALMLQLINESD